MAKEKSSKETRIVKKTNFDLLAEEEPARELELPEELADKEFKSLTEKREEAGELSDMKAVLARLFPEGLGDEAENATMVARISPDVFLDLLYLMTEDDVFKTSENDILDVPSIVLKNYTLLSIGLDGKGRIDQLELAGSSKETEELEKLGKGLFGA